MLNVYNKYDSPKELDLYEAQLTDDDLDELLSNDDILTQLNNRFYNEYTADVGDSLRGIIAPQKGRLACVRVEIDCEEGEGL